MQLCAIILLILVNDAWGDSLDSSGTEIKSQTYEYGNNNEQLLNFLREMKQDLHQMQQKNQELAENRSQVSKKLSTMEKKLFGIAERGIEMPRKVMNPILKPFEIPSKEKCWIRVNSTCYWAEVHRENDVNGAKAGTICRDRNSEMGQIPDYYTYEQVTRYLKTLIPKDLKRISVLFDLRVDQATHEVFPPSYYTRWRPSRPKSGYGFQDATYVYLALSNDPNDNDVGMSNWHFGWNYQGVLCQVPLPKHLYPNPTLKLEQLDAFYGTANCDIRINSTCYWTKIHSNGEVNYKRAEQICHEKDSIVAQIQDRYTYDHVMSYLRTQIPTTKIGSLVWIDLRVKPTTGEVLPTNRYTRWAAGAPRSGYGYGEATYTFLNVKLFVNGAGQGMQNYDYGRLLNGVLCRQKTEDEKVKKPKKMGNCDIKINSTCYWAELHSNADVTYKSARQICNEENSVVGQIPNAFYYEQIIGYLRTKIPTPTTKSIVWFDLRVKPTTGEVLPTKYYTRWASGAPRSGYGFGAATYSFINVEIFENTAGQGMLNYDYNRLMNGVLCQYEDTPIIDEILSEKGKDACEGVLIGETCYWAKVHREDIITKSKASQICTEENSLLAHIPDKHAYGEIMEYLRTKIYVAQSVTSVWINLEYTPQTGVVQPVNSYTWWSSGYPSSSYPYSKYNLVYLFTEIFVNDPGQGMRQGNYRTSVRGALCQRKI